MTTRSSPRLLAVSRLVLMATILVVGGTAAADAKPAPPPNHSRAAPAQRRVFFGELHIHTGESFDAWIWGTKLTPDQAYRFAMGHTITVPAAQVGREQGAAYDHDVPARRAWPLDFMAVTDHSEFMGGMLQFDDPANPISHTELGKKILGMGRRAFGFVARATPEQLTALNAKAAFENAWAIEQKAANDNYRPGKFTTFIAYEWSSTPDGKHLHRNVIFNADHAPLPFTSNQSDKPEDLWKYLEAVRAGGIDVIAIPHNGNLSGGLMYDWNDSSGRPISEAYAEERALNEPLTEITQIKGQSETTPELSPNDEFANFEIFDHLYAGEKTPQLHHGSYIREAFGRGLVIQSKVGANPFKYGVVGDSDIHNGMSASDESAMGGGAYGIDPKTMFPTVDTARKTLAGGGGRFAAVGDNIPLDYASAGITGVWAEENTRSSIFAALKRKETFATTGTRIRVRLFGGWGFDPGFLKKADWVADAYAQGAPMGGDLPAPPRKTLAPSFIVQASKDPDGANLDRIQIIKVWLVGGAYQEKVFNVALSDHRRIDPVTGAAPKVGNSVNLKTGVYSNRIGAAVLSAVWRDPQFKPEQAAAYYARVLEIPTPRWSTLLAIKSHLPLPDSVAATIQERAYSSPIWYASTETRHPSS